MPARSSRAGTPSEIFITPKHPYTRKLIAAAPGRGELKAPGRGGTPMLKVEDACKTYGDSMRLKDVCSR